MNLDIRDLGLMDYEECLTLQRNLFNRMIESRRQKLPQKGEYLLLAEHNPVITLGRRARAENVLWSESMLLTKGIRCIRIERGGDVTFHGPGQMVAYPLIDLEYHHLGVKDFVNLLEEAVIQTLDYFSIIGLRLSGAPGIWIKNFQGDYRKICALGLKCSRFCTMHGIALNVNTDLDYFRLINPCGFSDKGVSSMQLELDRTLNIDEVKKVFISRFGTLLNSELQA